MRLHQPHRAFATKYFALVCIVFVVGFLYAIYNTQVDYQYPDNVELLYHRFLHNITRYDNDTTTAGTTTSFDLKLKYILQWNTNSSPFHVMGEGQNAFMKLNCTFKNCYVTYNRDFLGDFTKFDSIVFSGKHLYNPMRDKPDKRSATQKYIFGATESAHNYRICDPEYDGFFNWTWTYRLDSDIRWGYITIYDLKGNVVGPHTDMDWPELDPVSEDFKKKLNSKTKAVAWFVSHCTTLSKREDFVKQLSFEAKKYNWTVDIYGNCGTLKCPRGTSAVCYDILEKDYYFYLSFENSFAQDYVTEKLLNALDNNVVPIVFGTADYSRFVPPGSYLDARQLGPAKLAATMDEIMQNKTRYADFFRWKNHFVYKQTYRRDVCNLCEAMNNEDGVRTQTVYTEFRKWWNDEQWDGSDTC